MCFVPPSLTYPVSVSLKTPVTPFDFSVLSLSVSKDQDYLCLFQRRRSCLSRESINFVLLRGENSSLLALCKFDGRSYRWNLKRRDGVLLDGTIFFDGFHWHRKFDDSKIRRTSKHLRQCGFTDVDNEIAFYSGKRCNFLQRFFSARTYSVETPFAYLAESRKYSRENKISKCFVPVNHLFIGTGNNLIIGVVSTTFPQSFKSLGIYLNVTTWYPTLCIALCTLWPTLASF